jgi:hypothetical protein
MVRSTRMSPSRFLPLGFILLLIVGCALGPGYGAAPSKDSLPGKTRFPPPQESSEIHKQQPSAQKSKAGLPPTPTKPPAIGGSGG